MGTAIYSGGFLTACVHLNAAKEALYEVATNRRFALPAYNGHEYLECLCGPVKVLVIAAAIQTPPDAGGKILKPSFLS